MHLKSFGNNIQKRFCCLCETEWYMMISSNMLAQKIRIFPLYLSEKRGEKNSQNIIKWETFSCLFRAKKVRGLLLWKQFLSENQSYLQMHKKMLLVNLCKKMDFFFSMVIRMTLLGKWHSILLIQFS